MTLGWSRACYVELVRKADTAAFIQCHVNAFEYLGGVPRRCLYDNAKVVTLGRDEEKRPIWNQRMLDFAFARRVGFEARLCRPYRAQTKGKVENGVKYVRRNMWPSIRFTTASGRIANLCKADTAAFIQCHVCLRVSGRCAPPVPLRQCQGGHAGPRRREATDLEPADAGFRPRLLCQPSPARARWRTGSRCATCGPASASPRHHLETGT